MKPTHLLGKGEIRKTLKPQRKDVSLNTYAV